MLQEVVKVVKLMITLSPFSLKFLLEGSGLTWLRKTFLHFVLGLVKSMLVMLVLAQVNPTDPHHQGKILSRKPAHTRLASQPGAGTRSAPMTGEN